MNVKQLSPLNPIKDEKTGRSILQMALERDINLYAISKIGGYPIQLDPGRIQFLLEHHPKKALVCFKSHSGYITPPKAVADGFLASGNASELCYRDLWARKSDLEPFLAGEIGKITEETYLNIIGALKDIILVSGRNYLSDKALIDDSSPFRNQNSLIGFMLKTYGDISGVNKRTLENKFASANKMIEGWQN